MDPLRHLSPHSLLNIESLVAIAFLLALLIRARPSALPTKASPQPDWRLCLGLCLAVFLVYARALGSPFLYDDYTHITDARDATWRSILAAFGPVEHPPGLFYRPFGFLIYWLNYQLAGPDPRLWHAASLAFHAIDACLVYTLSLALRLGKISSAAAAVLFAFSGAAVEPAAWIDSRFDPMATMLVLASLLCVCRFLDYPHTKWVIAACLFGIAGFTSKESAFCLPLLVACLWFFRSDRNQRLALALAATGTVAAAAFVYRWWALGGIGGYRSAGGASNLESFSLVRLLNAVFIRDWTILFFPINWSGPLAITLAALLMLTPVVFAIVLWRGSRIARPRVLGALLFTLFAALPVQHLLLIGVDLANTRYLYLLSVGWALLWGTIFAGVPHTAWRCALIGWILALHIAIGQHNLSFWLQVAEDSKTVCEDFARSLPPTGPTAIVGPLPQRKNGVVFLANGFPQCVEMNGHMPPGRVSMFGSANFFWDFATARVTSRTK